MKVNKWNLFFLLVPILFVVCIWDVNIQQLWFEFSPQEKLGSPPKQAEKIVFLIPTFDYSINKFRAYVFVQTEGNEIYRCCSWHNTKDWIKVDEYKTNLLSDELACAEDIKGRWNISKNRKGVIHRLSLGWCSDSSLDLYSSYQINRDGTVSGKTVRESALAEIFTAFQLLCLRPISIAILVWFIFKVFTRGNVKSFKAKQT